MADYGIGQGINAGIQAGAGIAAQFANVEQQRKSNEMQQKQFGLAQAADVRAEQSHGIAMQIGLLELKKLKANAEMVNVDNLINLFPDQRDQSIAKRLIAPYRSPENPSEVRSEDIRAAYKDLRDPTKQAGFLTWKLQDIASDKEKVLADYTTKKGSMKPWEATDENMQALDKQKSDAIQALDKQKSDAIAKLDDEERRLKLTSVEWAKAEGTKNKPVSDIEKLIQGRDKLPPNHPDRKTYDDKIKKLSQGNMTNIYQEADALVREQLKKDGVTREPLQAELTSMVDTLTKNRAQYKTEGGVAGKPEEKTTLKPTTVKNEGIKYAITGKMGGLGMGNKANRTAIQNAATEWQEDEGLSAVDLLTMQSAYKADQIALQGLQKRSTWTSQSQGQALNNAKALETASGSFSRSNYPGPNRIIKWAGTQAGSPQTQAEIGQFEVALLAFAREYMRVTTGAAASVAELTIGAQEKVDTILSRFDSWSTLKAKVEQAKKEMLNTVKSHEDEIKKTELRLNNPVEYIKKLREKEEDAATGIQSADQLLQKWGVPSGRK